LSLLLLLLVPSIASSQTTPLGPQDIEVAFPNLTFEQPTAFTHAGDGSGRIFVAEKEGRIRVFPNDPSADEAKLFLDISAKVAIEHPEMGFLGLAFDPDYEENGFFYVNYTTAPPRRSVVSRFQVSASDPDKADPASEFIILELEQPFPNHNGGNVMFGPDGYLYLSFGDGGDDATRRDPFGNGQRINTLLGKILRIDVRDATADEPYRVPEDNPFVGDPGARPEVWAYGLRNPWRFSFDPSGEFLWVGDVGQNSYEEINIVRPGGNYGWSVLEGTHCFPPGTVACNPDGKTPPLIEYPTYENGCAVTGGYIYRGFRASALRGAYVYSDYCSGQLWALRYDGQQVTQHEKVLSGWGRAMIPAFGEDADGELYMLDHKEGRIYWFVENDPIEATPTPPAAVATPGSTPSAGVSPTPAVSPTPSMSTTPTPVAGGATPVLTPTPRNEPSPVSTPTPSPLSDTGALLPALAVLGVVLVGGGSLVWLARTFLSSRR
jgi:glucose/arabinose dehydrogenase